MNVRLETGMRRVVKINKDRAKHLFNLALAYTQQHQTGQVGEWTVKKLYSYAGMVIKDIDFAGKERG